MRISAWISDVCSSDFALERMRQPGVDGGIDRLPPGAIGHRGKVDPDRSADIAAADETRRFAGARLCEHQRVAFAVDVDQQHRGGRIDPQRAARKGPVRSEEHTSELQSLMRISY